MNTYTDGLIWLNLGCNRWDWGVLGWELVGALDRRRHFVGCQNDTTFMLHWMRLHARYDCSHCYGSNRGYRQPCNRGMGYTMDRTVT